MRAVLYSGDGRVSVEPVTEPELADPADAIVRVRRAAVCGTDLHAVYHPDGVPRGTILGHEFAGEIVETGPAVVGHRVGDVVVGADYTACGRCWWCRRGDHWECAERRFFGTGTAYGPALAGAQAEYVRVPHADTVLVGLPEGVDLDAAVFLGDTLATGFAAVRRAGLRPGDTLAVVGGGPVGQLTSLAAQALGAGVVVLVEPVESRRALAAEEGAVVADPDRSRDVVDRVTDGRGADAVIDAIGGPAGLDTAFGLVRKRGSVVAVGVHTDAGYALPVARAFAEELTLRFAVGNLMRDAPDLIGLVRSGAITPAVVASERIDLDDAPRAYRDMAERHTLKSLLVI
ncbi:alcohol dehydrogenase catalytic domain-containing protein [Pseudonocardia endophytica]|uniref:Threonine dehydrogenase-like Zn-dependent dehydrogenase n=1 Tax=Pseudonocardia endophytica TaxID=401976 RepID=A0A4R1HIA4_PSEEN|nr:alcohol dehydrogenase catalytic domain-containing protein [Pseudonocardia endophytica]TCK20671.1 threonine dehydrogenase-like Zn-dependent dehydrogenase [Pseudonocardia endophytica]